jgi:hypothetical protein
VGDIQIGGYQVLAKYLKDRKGRRMDDPVRYIHIATAHRPHDGSAKGD